MNAKKLKATYPRLWKSVYNGVYDDLRLAKKTDKFNMLDKTARRLCHNAAFFACSTIHVMVTK